MGFPVQWCEQEAAQDLVKTKLRGTMCPLASGRGAAASNSTGTKWGEKTALKSCCK